MRNFIISAILASAAVVSALPAAAQPPGANGRGGYEGDRNDGRGPDRGDYRGPGRDGPDRGGPDRGGFGRYDRSQYDREFEQIERSLQMRIRQRQFNSRQVDKVKDELNKARSLHVSYIRNDRRLEPRERQDLDKRIDRLHQLLHIGRYATGQWR